MASERREERARGERRGEGREASDGGERRGATYARHMQGIHASARTCKGRWLEAAAKFDRPARFAPLARRQT